MQEPFVYLGFPHNTLTSISLTFSLTISCSHSETFNLYLTPTKIKRCKVSAGNSGHLATETLHISQQWISFLAGNLWCLNIYLLATHYTLNLEIFTKNAFLTFENVIKMQKQARIIPF